jgi:hypothetical protein
MSTWATPLSSDAIICLFEFIHSTAGSGVGMLAQSILRNEPLPLYTLDEGLVQLGDGPQALQRCVEVARVAQVDQPGLVLQEGMWCIDACHIAHMQARTRTRG